MVRARRLPSLGATLLAETDAIGAAGVTGRRSGTLFRSPINGPELNECANTSWADASSKHTLTAWARCRLVPSARTDWTRIGSEATEPSGNLLANYFALFWSDSSL